jgi:hypothetical protein
MMPKYLLLWEVDSSRAPVNPKERGAAWLGMLNMIKQDIKDGKVIEWGTFVGEGSGYSVNKMTAEEVNKQVQAYYPYVTFKVHQVMSVDDQVDLAKSLTA